jgi:hypothetical protein
MPSRNWTSKGNHRMHAPEFQEFKHFSAVRETMIWMVQRSSNPTSQKTYNIDNIGSWLPIFRDNISLPSSKVNNSRRTLSGVIPVVYIRLIGRELYSQ